MKKFFIVLLFPLLGITASAQTTISGTVKDSTAHAALPYTTVRLFSPSNAREATVTAVTDASGRFNITTNKTGEARLLVSYIGMQPVEQTLTLGGGTLSLGDIQMMPATATLDAATVTAARPIVHMEPDKVAYDLQADPDTRSNTLLDMLRKVPLVTVDGNDNIQVAGQSGFKIYVDGKPQPMFNGQNAAQIMKSIPATYATKIEVITNPGARYDAEGTGGIINIQTVTSSSNGTTTQQQLDGYSLNINTNVGTRRQGASTNITWQRGPFTLSANAGFTHTKSGTSHFDFDRINHTTAGDFATMLRNENTVQNNMANGSLSLSYQIDTLRLITASGNFMSFLQHTDGTGTISTGGILPATSYRQTTRDRMRYTDISANLDYQRGFANCKERFLTLSYQFNHTPLLQQQHAYFSDFENIAELPSRYSDNDAYTTEHTAQADFTTPLAKNHTLSVGGKYIGRINSSDATMSYLVGDDFVPNADQSTLYKHYNDIGAGYAEYEGKFGKIGLKAGARYEHTWQRVRYANKPENNFSLDYGNLVPSATLSYQLAPTSSLGLVYKMRITRPFIQALNPYVNQADPTNISYGNPDLDAEETNAFGLVYSLFSPVLIVRAQTEASFTHGSIEEYSFYKDNVLNTTYGNLGNHLNAGVNLFVNVRPSLKSSFILNAGTAYVRYHSNALATSNHGWQANLMLGVQQELWWKLKLSANLFCMSRQIQLQGSMGGFGGVMGGITRSFFKDDMLTIGINGFMPLQGTSFKFKINTSGPDFTNRMSIRIPVAQIGITASLKLGRMGLTTRTVNRSIENTDGSSENPAASTTGGMTQGMGM